MNLLCTLLSIACTAGTITGSAYVHDGDTIYVNHEPVRLAGIDAEELDEPHGLAARDYLRGLIGDRLVTCHWDGWSYKRKVGVCFVTIWGPTRAVTYSLKVQINLNVQMVADGYALDCAYYSKGLYRSLEPAGVRSRLIQKPYCK